MFQTYEQDNCIFESFDQVDDASQQQQQQQRFEFDAIKSADNFDTLDYASKDLLNRLLEKNPQHRLKSILALGRIAFFHKFNFDDVRQRKVRKKNLCMQILNIYSISFYFFFFLLRHRQGK